MKRRSCRNMHIMQIWRYLNASAPNWVEKINLNQQINLNGYTKTVEFVCLLEISIWSKILIQDVLILYQNKRQGDFFTQLFIGNNKIKLTFIHLMHLQDCWTGPWWWVGNVISKKKIILMSKKLLADWM